MNKDTVKLLTEYNPATGKMYWREKDENFIKKESSRKSWNTRYAGKELKTVDGKGYYHCSNNGKFHRVHRLAWLYMYGETPNIIDHINGNRTDNRIENLREVTSQENHMNQKINSKNTSGVTGVYRNNRLNNWCAQMKFNGKTYHLGSSKNLFDAVCFRKSEQNRLGFSLRHGVKDAN
tara:strand:+ start:123 stop:656 length:534 start_codon:yes stop_codon:yes gene_type:complete